MSRTTATRRGLPTSTAGVSAPTDRRFKRPDVKPSRRRRLGQMVLRTGTGILAAAAVLGGGAWLAGSLLSSPALAVSHITVRGNSRLSRSEVEAIVDGLRGENILRVDFETYRKRLMDSRWVSRVALSRVLPSTVEISLVERDPVAVARLGEQLYLVDRGGIIIDEMGPEYANFDLPIVDGLVELHDNGSATVDPVRLRLTEQFLDELARQPRIGRRVSQFDVSNPRDVVALLDSDAALLHLGDSRFVERLNTFLRIAPTLRDQVADFDYVDLRFDERVYLRPHGQATAVRVGGGRE